MNTWEQIYSNFALEQYVNTHFVWQDERAREKEIGMQSTLFFLSFTTLHFWRRKKSRDVDDDLFVVDITLRTDVMETPCLYQWQWPCRPINTLTLPLWQGVSSLQPTRSYLSYGFPSAFILVPVAISLSLIRFRQEDEAYRTLLSSSCLYVLANTWCQKYSPSHIGFYVLRILSEYIADSQTWFAFQNDRTLCINSMLKETSKCEIRQKKRR